MKCQHTKTTVLTLNCQKWCPKAITVIYKSTFVAFPWVVTSTGPGGFMICVFIL